MNEALLSKGRDRGSGTMWHKRDNTIFDECPKNRDDVLEESLGIGTVCLKTALLSKTTRRVRGIGTM